MFAPFVNYFITTGDNPYEHFWKNGQGNEFPYPPLMLFLLAAGRLFTGMFRPSDADVFGLADSIGFRLPLLVADIVILLVLARWFRTRQKAVLYLYWFSPVAIYISYIHGQLDVIPMAFLFLSLHFLFRERIWLSVLMFALAFSCKTHMILVLPFYSWYVLKNARDKFKGLVLPLFTMLLLALFIQMLFLGPGYNSMVLLNKVQKQIFNLYYQFNGQLRIIFIPALLAVLIGWYLSLKFVNKNQLLLFLGFVFITLTLMIAPMQGWYYWILPFAVFFILRQGSQIELRLFFLLSALYFIYFVLTPDSDLGIVIGSKKGALFSSLKAAGYDVNLYLDLSFTLLQTTLIVFAWLVYKNGIRQNIQSKFLSRPYIIGIGGDSASGKSSLSEALERLFGGHNTGIIRGDDMHKWERGDEHWKNMTHLNPGANDLHENLRHTIKLKRGGSIRRRHYDHKTGRFTLPYFIKPKKLLVFEGLHSFYLRNNLDVYDLKIFMSPDEPLRRFWKVSRDVQNRGYSPELVLEQIELREEDSEKFIRTQAETSDLRYGFYPVAALPKEYNHEPEIGLKVELKNSVQLDSLIAALKLNGLSVKYSFNESDQIIEIEGNISAECIDRIAVDLLPELEEIGFYEPAWQSDFTGIMQLITAYLMVEQLRDEQES